MEIKNLYIVFILFISFSCEPFRSNFTRENLKGDVEEAENYVLTFYRTLSKEGIDSASTFFYESPSLNSGKEILEKVKLIYGEINKVDITNVSTTVVTSKDSETKNYNAEVKATYDSGSTFEKINIRTINGKLLIYEYEVEG